MYFVLFEIYVWLKPEIVLTEVTIKISAEFKPFYYITQGFNQRILIDGGKPYGLFNDFEWISLHDYPFYWVWNIYRTYNYERLQIRKF